MKYMNLHPSDQIAFMRSVKLNSGQTWDEIAKSLNLSQGMVFFYLNGKSKIPKENYNKLCKMAGIKPICKSYTIIKNKTQDINLVSETNEDLAELLGIMAGDGNISAINYQISVTCHRIQDRAYIQNHVMPLFNNLFGVTSKKKVQLHNNTIKCVVNSKNLLYFLTNKFGIPIGKKKGKLHIPQQIIKNRNLLICYLRGLFDTDGSVYLRRKKEIVISIASRDLNYLEEVKNAFLNLEYRPSVSGKNLCLYRKENVKRFFQDIGSSNPKHQNRYDNFINKLTVVTPNAPVV